MGTRHFYISPLTIDADLLDLVAKILIKPE